MLPVGKSLDISTAGNWTLEYASVRTATDSDRRSKYLNGYFLEPFDIPVLIESLVIAIRCSKADAKPSWNSAGTLLRVASFPKNETVLEDDAGSAQTAVLDKRYLRLNSDFEILIFNESSSTLQLTFIPKPWLDSIGIVIYSYSGPVHDLALDKLDAIRAKLEVIDSKV